MPDPHPLIKWLRNEPEPAPEPPPEPSHEERQAALMSWIRGESAPLQSGKDARVPDKFQTFEPPQVRPGRTFTRAAVEGALDAAALPVVAASRAADYVTGRDSQMSHLSGKEAAESLEYLYDKTEPAQIRREENFASGEIPQAQSAGKFVGEYTGGAPLAALTGRVPALGPILKTQSSGRPASRDPDEYLAQHPDRRAVRDYMGGGYMPLNESLRRGNPHEYTEAKAQKIDRFLADAKADGLAHEGATTRFVLLPAGTAEKWEKAGAVTNKSFWSTSSDPAIPERIGNQRIPPQRDSEKVILRLQQNSGVPVGRKEGEVLIPRGRNWLIKGHEIRDDGTRVIDMVEVPELPPGVKPELSYEDRDSDRRAV